MMTDEKIIVMMDVAVMQVRIVPMEVKTVLTMMSPAKDSSLQMTL